MKRRAIWFLIASSAFIMGVALATMWPKVQTLRVPVQHAEPDIPFVAFCELVHNPTAYNQKVIRTKAILYWGTDGLDLSSTECDDSYIIGGCFRASLNTCEEIRMAIMKSRGGKNLSWVESKSAIDVVGKFSVGDERIRHRFDMLVIKDAKAINATPPNN